jgi:mono/diheme cytochrome c family protein
MRSPWLLLPALAIPFAGSPRSLHAQSAAPTGATPPSASPAAAAAARQLDLGEQWFRSACLECHAVRGLDNADFRLKWDGRNAFDLFERIRSTMPESRPGTLTQGTYASIVAYLMKLNGMKVGATLVPSDSTALAAIRLRFATASAVSRP